MRILRAPSPASRQAQLPEGRPAGSGSFQGEGLLETGQQAHQLRRHPPHLPFLEGPQGHTWDWGEGGGSLSRPLAVGHPWGPGIGPTHLLRDGCGSLLGCGYTTPGLSGFAHSDPDLPQGQESSEDEAACWLPRGPQERRPSPPLPQLLAPGATLCLCPTPHPPADPGPRQALPILPPRQAPPCQAHPLPCHPGRARIPRGWAQAWIPADGRDSYPGAEHRPPGCLPSPTRRPQPNLSQHSSPSQPWAQPL